MEPKRVWECTACGKYYDSEDEAAECRCHWVKAWYVCPVCQDSYQKEDECMICITSHDDAQPVMVTAEELEAAGQERLMP